MAVNTTKTTDTMQLAWLLRADLRRGLPASKKVPDWFREWWAMDGYIEYPAAAGGATAQRRALLALLPDGPRYGMFGMTPALRYLLERREDLQQTFDASTEAGLWHAIAWFFTHGLKEYGLLEAVDAPTLAALDETPPFLRLPDAAAQLQPPLTWLMFFVWRCAPDLQAAFDLRNNHGQAVYLHWFLFEGVPNLQLAALVAPRWRVWLQESLALKSQPAVGVPRAAVLLWQRRPDMQQKFDLRLPQTWVNLASWEQQARQSEPALRWITQQPTTALAQAPAAPGTTRPFGLNLIGFAFGELGIGEDVRMAVAACEAASIPFKVLNIHPGDRLRQADLALADHVTQAAQGEDEAPYAINLFCLTGFDTVRVFLERGAALFGGRYNIGWWPWELPVWPKDWTVAFDFVDEVWAASEFTREMYTRAQSKSAAPVPVTKMPLPASVARVQTLTRRQLGLPARQFLFLYVFDFNSYLARKNPFAAVQAFRKAFAAEDRSVRLVLKTMNADAKNPVWRRFVKACAADARIVLMDKTMERSEVLGLIKACDAYVSLHRSEGFGRTLAEALLLGKPVVATNFSGNVDFLTDETGFPVRWKRRALAPGEYPFVAESDHAWWAEPDIADAARQMRAARSSVQSPSPSLQSSPSSVRSLSPSLGAQRGNPSPAEEQFSPHRIGVLMRQRARAVYRDLE